MLKITHYCDVCGKKFDPEEEPFTLTANINGKTLIACSDCVINGRKLPVLEDSNVQSTDEM